MRALAHVEKILAIDPIPGADAIEAAQVLGWSVVVKKGDFQVGDLAVFFEIDSFLNAADPRYATFEERFINWDGKRGMRLKTIKLRGQISQGLVLKVSEFTEIKNPEEGQDVTELLKIEKWESMAERESNAGGAGRSLGTSRNFPGFIQKTDQNRVQSYMAQLGRHMGEDEDFEVSIKLDGSSLTTFTVNQSSKYYKMALELSNKKVKGWKKYLGILKRLIGLEKNPPLVSGICSRNLFLGDGDTSHFTTYVQSAGFMKKLAELYPNYALQGELIGPAIQANYEKVNENQYYVFDVFDIEKQEYVLPYIARKVAHDIGVKYVPVLDDKKSLTVFKDATNPDDIRKVVDNILAFAEGPGMNSGVKREGVVFKSNKTGLSFKAISNSYLLKKEKSQKD